LCGGPGAGFLWVSPQLIPRCAPRDVGWFSHAEPFAFDIHDYRDHPGALRFWGGTPSVLPFVVATEGLRLIGSIGVEAVRAHNLHLSRLLIDAVPEVAVFSPLEDTERGGTVVLQFDTGQAAAVAALRAIGVRFDDRPTGMRLSPHVYNTAEEITRVVAALENAGARR
ncbi:MAG: aminotransferase class V-fold PLP-dependent enzyme, partial [Gammaproteobacteria bacterium]